VAGPNLNLSYPAWAAGFVLESRTNLTSPWTPAGVTPTISSNRTVATWPATKGPRCFRLRSP